jgi:Skp family chaperone for outer membrane proteins
MKLGYVSQELDTLSQKREDEVQAHENDVQNLTCGLRNAEASRDKLKQEYGTSETERAFLL